MPSLDSLFPLTRRTLQPVWFSITKSSGFFLAGAWEGGYVICAMPKGEALEWMAYLLQIITILTLIYSGSALPLQLASSQYPVH
ncbi:hypothetical protein LX32DRAFT_267616 [Colletotrichum zoysiae]|uniref:Uncharacterized protein n=1 Tax=Colletotrichum zoysiae TaxID=1216348 RepID=A0AAD9HNV1_9PEZI|nr:hypothetical protein LX32DRAFT_267616 [Colletotrichum zoysiae]